MLTQTKRILYLCNHKLLLEFECQMLLEFGFEVFLPKKIPSVHNDPAFRSMKTDESFDKTLTIPEKELTILNSFNFYEDDFSPEIRAIINFYFDYIITAAIEKTLMNVLKNYKKQIIIRLFGMEGTINYEMVFKTFGASSGAIENIFKPRVFSCFSECLKLFYFVRDRVYFGTAYKSIIEHETIFFKERSLYLPVGVSAEIWDKKDSWVGTEKKIMFVCPSIDNPYYAKIYKTFKEYFQDLPHTIFGRQNKKHHDDNAITGYLPREQFDEAIRTYTVMFYHSQEPRHLHNHPLEAVIFGQPLIFMSGGILESFSLSNQPGMCKTFEDAHDKITRILSGNKDFIKEIINNQKEMLKPVLTETVKNEWEKNFPFERLKQ